MQKKYNSWQSPKILLPALSVSIAVVIQCLYIYTATKREFTSLENALIQSFSLVAGLGGSYVFGKHSAKDAAMDMMRPHARSAFRRSLALYSSLSRVAVEIEKARNPEEFQSDEITLAKLEAIVIEQISTAGDALDDWSDLVPEEIEEVRNQLAARGNGESINA
ncbi:MAG: hypothetical protein DCF25_02070 [Leptolyngbya foveolarum]|uniref:Uncharacterized protein n=1 Tax=Leptolyngbya foveolarum TaxID=47253 RepID=A0A2W4UPC5_9CYAN|nr:MAG: hypothetical protein DCF25_02070 [Leptolyngbya foveolarum]